jgi:hypothetical protein
LRRELKAKADSNRQMSALANSLRGEKIATKTLAARLSKFYEL